MRSTRVRVPRVAILAGLALSIAGTSQAQQQAWDQAAVTSAAKELPPAIESIDKELRARPMPGRGTGDSKDYHRFRDIVRRLRLDARHLVAQLEDGKGHDETLPSVEHMMMLVRDAREVGQRIFRTTQLSEKIGAARAILDRITPYYDAKPLPPPLKG